jgi:hypothetical protein
MHPLLPLPRAEQRTWESAPRLRVCMGETNVAHDQAFGNSHCFEQVRSIRSRCICTCVYVFMYIENEIWPKNQNWDEGSPPRSTHAGRALALLF